MAQKLKINSPNGNHIHFNIMYGSDYTLCGLETAGDSFLKLQPGKITDEKANCPDCVRIVKFCQNIKPSELAG